MEKFKKFSFFDENWPENYFSQKKITTRRSTEWRSID